MSKQLDEAARLLAEAEKQVAEITGGPGQTGPEKKFQALVTLASLNIQAANIAIGENA